MVYRARPRPGLVIGGLIIAVCVVVTSVVILHTRQEVAQASSMQVDTSGLPKPLDPRANTVAYIGDSYTAGSGSGGYDRAFATLVAAYEGWAFRNFAYGGTGYVSSVTTNAKKGCGVAFCPEYGAVIGKVAAYDPTIVVVSGGRNDVDKSDATVRNGIDSFYRTLREKLPKAQIIATSPIWDSGKPPAALLRERIEVQQAVEGVGGAYLDLMDPLLSHDELISGDGIHPNGAGHAAIARAVEVAISRNHELANALKTVK